MPKITKTLCNKNNQLKLLVVIKETKLQKTLRFYKISKI